jgi:predicted transcriptional regulator
MYVAGKGWGINSERVLNVTDEALVNRLVTKANEVEDLNDILEKSALDFELFDGFALEVIPKKGGSGFNIYHVPFQNVRTDEDAEVYYVSDEWHKYNPEIQSELPAFEWNKPDHGILYVKNYRPGTEVYPVPSYIGAIPYILTDIEIANFHYNSIRNGFSGGTIINLLNGMPPTKEAKEELYREFTEKLVGSDNANSMLLNFADGKERAAEILHLHGNDFDKKFDILNQTVRKEIFSGHRVSDPALFGIFKDGNFSQSQDLADAWQLFQNTYITPRQMFIERIFNGLAAVNGLPQALEIQVLEPVSVALSEATVVGVMTRAEIRERAGLPREEEETPPPTEQEQFSEQTALELRVAERFASVGYSLDEWKIIKSRKVSYVNAEQLLKDEKAMQRFAFAAIDPLRGQILEILFKDPFMTTLGIAQLMNITTEQVVTLMNEMAGDGLLRSVPIAVGEGQQRTIEVTDKGKRTLDDTDTIRKDFRIAYRYVVRDGAGAPIIPTTRPFCKRMVELSEERVWTATQITNVSLEENRNVWLRGGGFWTRKGTNVTTPHCRHEWEQVVITQN